MFRNRTTLMCLSILGVICYHLCLRGIHIGRLNVGYAGVDIFMLLSGYGIAKSLARNSIKQFYIHRLQRILPLWIIMISSACIINLTLGGGDFGLETFLLNITSLSFYYNPDLLPEWYLSTLLLFYAVSPLLKMLLEKYSWRLLTLVSLVVVLEGEFLGTGRWQYDNAVARFPLYLLGMQCALNNKENLPYKVTIPLFLLSIAFFFQGHHYLFSACAVLFTVQIANILIDRWGILKNKLFNWIGSHTLEIYVGNTIAAIIAEQIFSPEMNILTKLSIDIMMTISLSLLLWKLNSQVHEALKSYKS
ncbi:acyltransferase family protein [Bacteroides rodentium]|uniref:acyltransferase family protein n=1 Tax=Bacteroides rodentium TaxID=691816 RepID=UPI00046FFF0B